MGGAKGFTCRVCSKVYKHEKKLERHMRSVHMRSLQFQCLTCSKIMTSEAKLLQHSKGSKCLKKPTKLYICQDCDETFPKVTSLRKHVKLRHNKKEKKQPKAASTSVYFEGDEDVDQCLHNVNSDPAHSVAPDADAAVETTWR